jgi:hypothetical protein
MSKYLFVLGMVLWLSCYTRKEGCLDTLAANFDVSADDACTNCCVYPKLVLVVDPILKNGKSDTLSNTLGQKFVIQDVRFYVSDFTLFQKQNSIKINEVIGTLNNALIINNDMKILRSADSLLEIGSIKTFGKFDSLSFCLGLKEDVLNNSFVNLPTNHVLSENGKLQNSDRQTALMTLRFKRIMEKDSIFNITILHNNKWKYVIRDSENVNTTVKGESVKCKIQADYRKLFQNVNLRSTNDSISKAIELNLNTFLFVK